MENLTSAQAAASAGSKGLPGQAEEPSLSYVVGRLHQALRRNLGEGLASLGITLPQYTALSVLKRRGALSNAQLARRVMITPQSTIKVISALERKQLITRVPDPDHGRIRRTLLTPTGQDVLEACDRVAAQIEAKMLDELPERERARLLAGLRSCVRMLGAGL
jgi:DNA-binding MarR family transcriptional regulator